MGKIIGFGLFLVILGGSGLYLGYKNSKQNANQDPNSAIGKVGSNLKTGANYITPMILIALGLFLIFASFKGP